MGATQLNHGRQAEELIEAGLMLDLTDAGRGRGLARHRQPALAARQLHVDGRIYCVPVNIHSWQWIWLSQQGLRRGRRCRADQLGRIRGRRARARSRRHRAAGHGSAGLAAVGRLRRDGRGDRRSETLDGSERRQERRSGRRSGICQGLRGGRRRARDGRELERAGLEPGHQHGHHRPGRRADHGRLGAGRIPGGRSGRRCRLHLPAGSGRERDLSTPAAMPSTSRSRAIRKSRPHSKSWPRCCSRRKCRWRSTSRRARCRCAATSTCRRPTTACRRVWTFWPAGNILPAGDQTLSPDTQTQIEDLMAEFWSTRTCRQPMRRRATPKSSPTPTDR